MNLLNLFLIKQPDISKPKYFRSQVKYGYGHRHKEVPRGSVILIL